jgi:hypothetical protein
MGWVTEPGVEVVYGFTDRSGHRATMHVYMDNTETDPTGGGAAAVGSAAQGISNDALVSVECRVRASEDDPGVPTDGPYCRGADKALFVLTTEDGSTVNLQIGAPNEGIFDSGALEIDFADAAVIALMDALIANAVTAEGDDITGAKRGYRRRPANRKHL